MIITYLLSHLSTPVTQKNVSTLIHIPQKDVSTLINIDSTDKNRIVASMCAYL